ncbi:hypothetical protein L209DRAFT_749512 [Thermothelomyces heterothallicus CBS 203.75]
MHRCPPTVSVSFIPGPGAGLPCVRRPTKWPVGPDEPERRLAFIQIALSSAYKFSQQSHSCGIQRPVMGKLAVPFRPPLVLI